MILMEPTQMNKTQLRLFSISKLSSILSNNNSDIQKLKDLEEFIEFNSKNEMLYLVLKRLNRQFLDD